MINHYLLTLTPEQEDLVLTTHFESYANYRGHMPRCFVQCVNPGWDGLKAIHLHQRNSVPLNERHSSDTYNSPGMRYETLCRRWGDERINAMIRNRILSNRANRVLRNAPQLETV